MSAVKKQLKQQVQAAANNVTPPAATLSKQMVSKSKGINVFGDSDSFNDAQRMANALATADFTPPTFRGKMANCLLALEMSSRMGASVVAVMQNMYIVKNKPAWSATYIIAAINTSGRFKTTLMYEMEKDNSGTITGCYAYAYDRQDNKLEGPKVTMTMVKGEGWISNTKWIHMPDVMFRYRAASFFGKMYTPDILMGMQTVEELEDVYDVQATPTSDDPQHQDKTIDQTSEQEQTQVTQNQTTAPKPSEEDDVVDAVIEEEEVIETPAYLDADITPDSPPIEIPVLKTLDDFGTFIESLGLNMTVKASPNGDKNFAGLSGNTEGLDEVLKNIGFSLKRNTWVRDVTNMVLEKEAKGLF